MVDRDINHEKLKKHFGKLLRESRIEQELTLEEVAKNTYLDDKYLGKIENGNRGPGLLTLYKLKYKHSSKINSHFHSRVMPSYSRKSPIYL